MKSNTTSIEPNIADYFLYWQTELSNILEQVVKYRLSSFKSALEKEKGAALSSGSIMMEEREDDFWVDEHRGPYKNFIDYIKKELDCDFYTAVFWVMNFVENTPDEINLPDTV